MILSFIMFGICIYEDPDGKEITFKCVLIVNYIHDLANKNKEKKNKT